ncbi:MAG: class I SAM-dependent methyltransferase [Thermoplasmata archaeon]
MPAADRAMWTRLYAEGPLRELPWANQGPFPLLVRVVRDEWLSRPGPILDVGCGVGTNTFWLASQGFRATGIDIAPGAVDAAQSKRTPEMRNPNFLVDDVLASALPEGRFRGAVDVGCFQTLPPKLRGAFSISVARLLSPGASYVVFWVAREETGSWGPPHRLSVSEVTDAFEPQFLVQNLEYRPRIAPLTQELKRAARPLATLAGYTARLVRRRGPQPGRR